MNKDIREHFRKMNEPEEKKSVFSNWEELYDRFKKYDKKKNCFYMLTTDKGSGGEKRTKFLTYDEALETILYEIEKHKAK